MVVAFCAECKAFKERFESLTENCLEGTYRAPFRNYAALERSAFLGCALCRIIHQTWHDKGYSEECNNNLPVKVWGYAKIIGVRIRGIFICYEGSDTGFTLADFVHNKVSEEQFNHYQTLCRQMPDLSTPNGFNRIISLASTWIQSCCETHMHCGSYSATEEPTILPTRLIDVGTDALSQPPRLFIPSRHLHSLEYIALSYAWGSGNFVKTTASNLDSMKRQIPWPQLPRTIQDAIELTRHLGVKYLWVDALCILQSEGLDDQKHREDWSCEVVRFGKYYENALLTIAATGGSSSEQGLFFSRPLSQFGPTSITFQTADHSIYTVRSRVLDWRTETITAPLFKRGWAIQERLLSRRVLHFARNMILWECQECRATELDPKGLNPRGLDDDGGVEDECITKYRDLHVMDLTPQDAIEEWYRFLHIYSKSNFTFVSDRLPALSGIATIIQKHVKQRYIAGLWELDIARGLAWYSWGPFSFDTPHLSGPRITSSPKKADSQLKLPSWSWAVSKSCILYFSNHDWTPLVELESYEVDSQGTSTSGQLRGAKLTLRGVLAMVNLSDLGFVPHADKVNVLRRGLEDYVSRFEAVCMDTILDSQTGYGFYPCLLLGSASPGSGDDTAGGALILKMTGQCLDNVKVYQRVGFMSLPIDECLSVFTGKKTTINLV